MAYDDTFEQVLRTEFEQMRKKYERQVHDLKEKLEDEKRLTLIEKAEREKQVQSLETTKQTLSNKVFSMRLKLDSQEKAEDDKIREMQAQLEQGS